MFLGGYLFAAPAVQIVTLAMEFGNGDPRDLSDSITAVAYFISACNLMQGAGNILWMPLANKYGRRPVYIISWLMCLGFVAWSAVATSYASELASRIMVGFSAGASECIAPITLAEIFFLHERGKVMG
jgi:MFS family permease